VVVVMTEAMAVAMVMMVMMVMAVMAVMLVIMMIVLVVLAHASIPLAGSAMCSNMVESRLLMCASAAA